MMNNVTIEKLQALKLFGMADELERQLTTPTAHELPFEHRVRSMVDHEITLRDHKRLQQLLRKANLPVDASIEDVDYRAPRGLDKAEFQTLCSLDWIRSRHSLVMTGPTGTGKSWLASALANQSCRQGLSCYFIRVPILMENLLVARATTTFSQKLANLKKFDLLILDDWGIEAFSKRSQNDLLELIDSQIGKRSMLFTSQMPLNVWHDAFDNKTVADALMDRIIHGSYHMQFSGESLRKTRNPSAKVARSAAK
ncbi:MAG: IS21-like element helper ATPase IstB [Burkholderiaceae bacterium]|jgi:DNA replication protein DnaC|nr:IS21-like element helper ATPase IstB [Polaromonas sp.]MDO8776074.1 IS21-like element helper ATPase IstB [Burkholderiaceae bacterium]